MKIAIFILIALCICTALYADTIKGSMDKVDIKKYEITVAGKKIGIAKATVFTQNDMNVTKNVIIRDLKDHEGETAICYGFPNKEGGFDAYKVKVLEGHR